MASARLRKRIAEVRTCGKCAKTGGLFVRGESGGLRRCGCLRGRLLSEADRENAKAA